jgi:hypothetical protein
LKGANDVRTTLVTSDTSSHTPSAKYLVHRQIATLDPDYEPQAQELYPRLQGCISSDVTCCRLPVAVKWFTC